MAEKHKKLIFKHSSTIGLREYPVLTTCLQRLTKTVNVQNHPIRVKEAYLDGETVNRKAEYDDLVYAANDTERPIRELAEEAETAARTK
jgi:uncharacterized protein (DUF111 family)